MHSLSPRFILLLPVLALVAALGSRAAAHALPTHARTQSVALFLPAVRSARPPTATRTATCIPTATPRPTSTPDPCQPLGGAYGSLSISGAPSDRPAEFHADLNMGLRGYASATGQFVGMLSNCSAQPADWNAPQLRGLFADHRRPAFTGVYYVYQWNWACNCRSSQYESPYGGPSFAQVAATPGEVLMVPSSGYTIDDALGYEVLVLYATDSRITIKYTRDDNVVFGYTLHLEDICVDAPLVALYQSMNAAGRWSLPALRAGQALGRARSGQVGLAIRDTGRWMDPRNCMDWWRL